MTEKQILEATLLSNTDPSHQKTISRAFGVIQSIASWASVECSYGPVEAAVIAVLVHVGMLIAEIVTSNGLYCTRVSLLHRFGSLAGGSTLVESNWLLSFTLSPFSNGDREELNDNEKA
jgi:hypothetical protein